jgi:hypothetical protein
MSCWVHNGEPKQIAGHFHEQRKGAKSIGATMLIEGQQYYGRIGLSKILRQQRKQDLSRRYFATNGGAVHVCRCVWTQAEIDAAKKRAAELASHFAHPPHGDR